MGGGWANGRIGGGEMGGSMMGVLSERFAAFNIAVLVENNVVLPIVIVCHCFGNIVLKNGICFGGSVLGYPPQYIFYCFWYCF